MSVRDDIIRQALTLGAEDRVYVADTIERSLAPEGFAAPELGEAWAVEIDRRIAAYDRGEVPADDVAAVMRRLREKLAARRADSA